MRPAVALLIALGLTLGGLALLVFLIPAAPMTGDGQYYIQFVRNGLQHGASSWHERRLLGPLLVRALPMDAQPGFFVLTTASLAATALLTWLAARDMLHDEPRALMAIPLLFGTWLVAPNLREYGLVDPLAWAFVAGVWWATVRRQWYVAAAVAAVGVVAKEIVVLSAIAAAAAAAFELRATDLSAPAALDRAPDGGPAAAVEHASDLSAAAKRPAAEPVGAVGLLPPNAERHFVRAIAVAAPAVLVALGLTLLYPGSGSDASAYVFKWVRDGLFSNGPLRAAFLLFASYGALWLLIPRGWLGLPDHLRRAAVVYLGAAVALPLVGSPERMEEAIFPVVISTALLATRSWHLGLVALFALACAVFVARIGGDARLPGVIAWPALALACALAVWSYLAGPRGGLALARKPDPGGQAAS
jgi:hypothetical protein